MPDHAVTAAIAPARRALVVFATLATAAALRADATPAARHAWPAARPDVFAWTWNRDDDLRFLPPAAGVAVVRQSLEFEGHATRIRANHGVLVAPASAVVLPVVHVDAFARWRPALDAAQEDALVRTIVDVAAHAPADAVQVDFEAAPSQRAFYRRVLERVRARRPTTWLSITALSSWCLDDRWTAGLPVDDIVPMAFELGPGADAVRRRIGTLAHWPEAGCTSVGAATDEPALHLPAHRTLFLYSPTPWTAAAWRTTVALPTYADSQ